MFNRYLKIIVKKLFIKKIVSLILLIRLFFDYHVIITSFLGK